MYYRKGFLQSFIVPLLVVVGLMVVSGLIYHGAASKLAPSAFRTFLTNVFGLVLFLSIWFSPILGVPLSYFRGALQIERVIIAFANPILWILKNELMVCCQFSGVELIYFVFLPWFFGIICVTLFLFSVMEIVSRFIHRRIDKEDPPRVLPVGIIITLVLGLAGTYIGLIKGQEWVYLVVHHYATHFLNQ